jgi:hypothetical protein
VPRLAAAPGLRREARDVQVGGRTIDRVAALTVREGSVLRHAAAHREGTAIAEKVLKEIRAGCRS